MMNPIANQNEQERLKNSETQTETVLNLENDEKLSINLNEISSLVVYDEIGNPHTMSDVWAEFKTIFVFVRSFLCFTTKEYVEDLALVPKELLKEKQIRVVVIGCADWKHIRSFRALTKFPYFILCDTDYNVYNRLGFLRNREYGKAHESVHVKSSTFRGMIWSSIRAAATSKPFDYQGDLKQQGGCLVVGPGPVLHYAHIDKHARDHCPINFLLQIVGISPVNFENERKKLSIINA